MNGLRKLALVAVVTALYGLVIVAGAGPAAAQSAEELIAQADKIQNDDPGIGFEISTDKNAYRIGEKVVFEFKADRDCYLSIIDIGTSGQTLILFPNKWHPENKIKKDQVYSIPPSGSQFTYKVAGPVGTERVKIIACIEPIMGKVPSLQEEIKTRVSQNQDTGGVFLSMKSPQIVLKDLAIEFSKIDPGKWATAELKIDIQAGGEGSTDQSKPAPEQQPAKP
jgi:hypothetical protein